MASTIQLVKGYSMPPGGPGMDYGRFAAHRAMGAFYGSLQPPPSRYYYADKRRMPADTFAPMPALNGCGCGGRSLGDDATATVAPIVEAGSMLPVLAAAGLGLYLFARSKRRRYR